MYNSNILLKQALNKNHRFYLMYQSLFDKLTMKLNKCKLEAFENYSIDVLDENVSISCYFYKNNINVKEFDIEIFIHKNGHTIIFDTKRIGHILYENTIHGYHEQLCGHFHKTGYYWKKVFLY